MGIFDFFKSKKKEESHYDVTNIKVTDLELGYVLDYDLTSWIVDKMYEYDWGDNFFTREFVINNGKKKLYLHIEEDDELEISVTEKVPIRVLGEHILDVIKNTDKGPERITYKDEVYYLDSENSGYIRNVENEHWGELIHWLYLDKEEEKLITIEQTGEQSFEATVGVYIDAFEISNILPQNSTDNV